MREACERLATDAADAALAARRAGAREYAARMAYAIEREREEEARRLRAMKEAGVTETPAEAEAAAARVDARIAVYQREIGRVYEEADLGPDGKPTDQRTKRSRRKARGSMSRRKARGSMSRRKARGSMSRRKARGSMSRRKARGSMSRRKSRRKARGSMSRRKARGSMSRRKARGSMSRRKARGSMSRRKARGSMSRRAREQVAPEGAREQVAPEAAERSPAADGLTIAWQVHARRWGRTILTPTPETAPRFAERLVLIDRGKRGGTLRAYGKADLNDRRETVNGVSFRLRHRRSITGRLRHSLTAHLRRDARYQAQLTPAEVQEMRGTRA